VPVFYTTEESILFFIGNENNEWSVSKFFSYLAKDPTIFFSREGERPDMSYFAIESANKRRYTPAAPQGAVLPKSYLKTEKTRDCRASTVFQQNWVNG
jgi:hypothetical protein